MTSIAPRLPFRSWHRFVRGALLALGCLASLFAWASSAMADVIEQAKYSEPTERYAHGVLGDAIEWGALDLYLAGGERRRMTLPDHLVFEDLEPRLHDLDGDDAPEVIVVLTHVDKGASLAVFGAEGLVTQTPFIGTRNRWLAPIGAGDLHGDGDQIIAYIDRPHLAKMLRLWRYADGKLSESESLAGLTNHRIGDDFIIGGIRNCGNGDEIVTADADWKNIMVTVATDGELVSRPIAPYDGRASVDEVMACR